tara:strand:+ start:3167 stop:3544 length:378 start_codon:yes stop_codon:yes gene_type:complete
MMLSWSVSSQNVIDSTRIRLTKPVAKLVVKDLIIGDGLKLEVQTLNELLAETNSKLDVTKNLVTNLETQVNNYQKIIDNKDLQLGTSSELSEKLKKQLEKEQRAKKLYKIGSTVGAAAVLLLLIQ